MSASQYIESQPLKRFDEVAIDLIRNGYDIIPVEPGQKGPFIKGWPSIRYDETMAQSFIDEGNGYQGVGIISGSVVGLDIDVTHQSVVDEITAELGDIKTLRIGRPPKALYVLLAEHDLSKRRSKVYVDLDGNTQAIELLGRGQQFVAYGIHSSTKKPYNWPYEDLTEVHRDDLPRFTETLWDQACEALDRAAAHLGWELKSSKSASEGPNAAKAPRKRKERVLTLERAKPRLNLGMAEIKSTLEELLEDVDDYKTWIDVGMALHHEFDGGDDGFALWDEWSSEGLTYKVGECKQKWAGFGPSDKHPITFASLLQRANKKAVLHAANDNYRLTLEPWCVPSARDIPTRDWLLGKTIERGVVSATIAPGGVGKSVLTLAEAISLACDGHCDTSDPMPGVGLLGQTQATGLRVGYVAMEDTPQEQDRRARAILDHYKIDDSKLDGRLFRLGADAGFKVAKSDGKTIVECEDVDLLKAATLEFGLDVIIIDPFVSAHAVPENDNGAIDHVVKTLAKLAQQTDCAIHLVHHVSKLGDRAVTADSSRGASAFANALRSMRGLSNMTVEECKIFGIDPKERHLYKRASSLKGNNSPGGDTLWFEMVSHDLGQGDEVGVPIRWHPPSVERPKITDDEHSAIMRVLGEEGPHFAHAQSKNWVGHRVAEVLNLDMSDKVETKAVKELLETWCEESALERYQALDPIKNRMRPALRINKKGFEPIVPPDQVVSE